MRDPLLQSSDYLLLFVPAALFPAAVDGPDAGAAGAALGAVARAAAPPLLLQVAQGENQPDYEPGDKQYLKPHSNHQQPNLIYEQRHDPGHDELEGRRRKHIPRA